MQSDGIYKRYYYIINLKNFLKPRIYPRRFNNYQVAKRTMDKISKGKSQYYQVVEGKYLKDFKDVKWVMSLGTLRKEATKYKYKGGENRQQKKSHRTLMRRRLRRMGILTDVKTSKTIFRELEYFRPITNTQKVAKSPNSEAKCFTVERLGEDRIYIIKNVKIAKKPGILFRIEALRVKKRNFSKWYVSPKLFVLNIEHTDMMHPLLISEVLNIIGDENRKKFMERCSIHGIKIR